MPSSSLAIRSPAALPTCDIELATHQPGREAAAVTTHSIPELPREIISRILSRLIQSEFNHVAEAFRSNQTSNIHAVIENYKNALNYARTTREGMAYLREMMTALIGELAPIRGTHFTNHPSQVYRRLAADLRLERQRVASNKAIAAALTKVVFAGYMGLTAIFSLCVAGIAHRGPWQSSERDFLIFGAVITGASTLGAALLAGVAALSCLRNRTQARAEEAAQPPVGPDRV